MTTQTQEYHKVGMDDLITGNYDGELVSIEAVPLSVSIYIPGLYGTQIEELEERNRIQSFIFLILEEIDGDRRIECMDTDGGDRDYTTIEAIVNAQIHSNILNGIKKPICIKGNWAGPLLDIHVVNSFPHLVDLRHSGKE